MNKTINLDDFIMNLVKASETKDISIELAATNFLEYLKQHNKRESTLKFYIQKMEYVKQYMDIFGVTRTSQINNTFFSEFTKYAKNVKKWKNTTVNKMLVTLKYMLRINLKYGYIDKIYLDVNKLESDEARYETVDDDTLRRLIEIKATYPLQQNCILSLLIETGIRRTELVMLKHKNIDYSNNSILLEHTKNKKHRHCFFTDKTALLLKEQVGQCKTEYLFENQQQTDHFEANAVSCFFYKIKKDLNVERLSPHMLRHTYATNLDRKNVDIETLRILLGHSDYSQLKKYIHKETDKLRVASLASSLF